MMCVCVSLYVNAYTGNRLPFGISDFERLPQYTYLYMTLIVRVKHPRTLTHKYVYIYICMSVSLSCRNIKLNMIMIWAINVCEGIRELNVWFYERHRNETIPFVNRRNCKKKAGCWVDMSITRVKFYIKIAKTLRLTQNAKLWSLTNI